jgi:hypothetical protein
MTMKKLLALAAIAVLPSLSHADGFGVPLGGISVTLGESKATQFNEEISKLIETVRIGTDRKPRIDAVRELEERYATQTSMAKTRIVDALLAASDDNDHAFRHFPVAALGHIAEQSDDYTVDRVAQGLGQKIENLRIRTPFTENGERADLLIAYARTGGKAHIVAARHADQFLDGVLDEVRESDSRGKTLAFRALNMFLGRAVNRIYNERRETFSRIARDLIPLPSDPEIDARAEYAKAMVFLNGRRTTILIDDPMLRQQLHDRLEAMYNEERDPSLRYYLGLHLGHRQI